MISFEQFKREAIDYCNDHVLDKDKAEKYRDEIIQRAKEYYDEGYSSYVFVVSVIGINNEIPQMDLEQYIKDTIDCFSTHDKEVKERYRKIVVNEAQGQLCFGIPPSTFAKKIIDITDNNGNELSCPICGEKLTITNSTIREEFSRYAMGMDYSPFKRTYYYRIKEYKSKICNSCDSKLNTRRSLLRAFVLFLAIGVPIGLIYGGLYLGRIINIAWIGLPLMIVCFISALVFPYVALFGDSFMEWLGRKLEPIFGKYKVEEQDAIL